MGRKITFSKTVSAMDSKTLDGEIMKISMASNRDLIDIKFDVYDGQYYAMLLFGYES